MGNDIAKYLYELGQLKRVKRSGWWIAGIDNPESVAEHSFRTAVIGYLLAQLEGADSGKVTLMALFHDVTEARINDLHTIARRYVSVKGIDRKVVEEQSERLPDKVGRHINSLLSELEEATSHEARVARDADILECLVQAREYQALGFGHVADRISNCQAALSTDWAKRIADECLKTEPREWWQGLEA
jgi:putative hydrolase of HD superfamily